MNIAADYLVVGAGLSGLAFVDTLIAESPEATAVVVDRRSAPGGHWVNAYPFVRLHSPSWYYGVHSLNLGADKQDRDGLNAGLYERASKQELLSYFSTVAQRLEATGRVRFLFDHSWDPSGQVRTTTGEVLDVNVRHAIVDAGYLENSVPATHKPSFDVADDAFFRPIGEMPAAAGSTSDFVVLGSGKTAVDACLWLLEDSSVDPDRVSWVRPREAWWHDRVLFQGLDLVGENLLGLATDASAIAAAASLEDLQERLEDAGNLVRLDPSHPASMFRGGMLSAGEVDVLRRIDRVVRLGHVVRVERDRILLDGGTIKTGPDVLVVDCTARGAPDAPPLPVWSGDTITLQLVRQHSPPFSAAVIAWVEAHRSEVEEKNRLCPPNPMAISIADHPRMNARTWATEGIWLGEPDLGAWIASSRLNILRDLGKHQDEPAVRASLKLFLSSIGGAIENAPRLA